MTKPWPVRAVLVLTFGALWANAGAAQSTYCDRLRSELASIERADGAPRPKAYPAAARQQRAELDKAIAFARSIGCQKSRFPIFGQAAPPQCGPLEAEISRMEASLAQLDAQARNADAERFDARRNAILAALDTNCRASIPQPAAGPRPPGMFEQLFGSPDSREVPVMPQDEPSPGSDDPIGPVAAGKTLCVRKCDGYYFPISPYAGRGRFETDAGLCQALCPNADVELYVQPSGGEISSAMSLTGSPYSALPNAFRYRRTFDPGCTCKRPGQSWVEALADAERLLADKRPSDIIVTPQQAEEMSRPKDPAKTANPGAKTATKPSTAPPSGARQATPLPAQPQAALPRLRESTVPTLAGGQ